MTSNDPNNIPRPSRRRIPRTLTKAEKELWSRVVRDVEPQPLLDQNAQFDVHSPANPSNKADPLKSLNDYQMRVLPSQWRSTTASAPVAPTGAVPSKLNAGDPRMDRHIRRGRRPIDAVIDLHGLTQIVAHERLKAFVARARLEGHGCILVITGKGGDPIARQKRAPWLNASPAMGPTFGHESGQPSSRGILRECFVEWVNESPLREAITRVAKASQNDGGEGAFYVFLKRSALSD